MFIQTEETPNPDVLKFLPGQTVLEKGSLHLSSKKEAQVKSPFAASLFDIVGVKAVFLGSDFISITKEEQKDWFVLKPLLLSTMIDGFANHVPLFDETAPAESANDEDDDAIVSQIKELLETRVRPAVAQDGGDIVFHDFEDGVVFLEMRGACSGCPSSTMTLKAGIENMLRYYVPEVQEVRPVAIEQGY